MPGFVQVLERDLQGLAMEDLELDDAGFGDLAADPPALLTATMQSLAMTPEVRTYLRALGRYLARRAIWAVKELLFETRPVPPNPWIEGLVMPFANEIIEGASQELRRRAQPWAIGLAAVTGLAGLGLGALVGRRRKGG